MVIGNGDEYEKDNCNENFNCFVPFCTSTDYDIDVSMDYINEVTEGTVIVKGYRVHNSGPKYVSAWLEGILTNSQDVKDITV